MYHFVRNFRLHIGPLKKIDVVSGNTSWQDEKTKEYMDH
jgi:hypothetical protein